MRLGGFEPPFPEIVLSPLTPGGSGRRQRGDRGCSPFGFLRLPRSAGAQTVVTEGDAMKRPLSLSRGGKLVVAVTLAAAGFGIVSAVQAAIPDSNGVIHGCVLPSGNLRVIDSASEACKGNAASLDWSQTGPRGPAGPAGPAGPQGPKGDTGAT